jgi:hypothetical protein
MLIVPLLIYHLELPGKITSHGNSSGTFSTEKSPSCFSELARLDRKITVKLSELARLDRKITVKLQ